MPSDPCPYSPRVAAQLADPAAHLDTELAIHLPSCEACRQVAAVAVRNWPTDRSPSPSLAEWLSESVGKATVVSPFQAEQLARGRGAALELGPYLLLDRLGAGGMGEVYRAWHKLLRREDAIKTVRPEIAENANAIRRFLREAEAIAKLRHPNVVHVYTADRAGAGYYLAMEYVPGTDLGKFARASGPIPVRLACEFVRQAAEGLHHAFMHGLVHRDIKPGNLLLHVAGRKIDGRTVEGSNHTLLPFDATTFGSPPDFTVKVADFGLARALAGRDDASEMTASGTVLGTTDYMAPEQAQDAHAADTRADVYSLGCTLYYLLTGAVPFPGGTVVEKMLRHATAPIPSPAALRADVPAALDAVVRKCLAKRPEERYQTPGELAAALLPFTRAVPPSVPAPAALDLPAPEPVHDTASWALAKPTRKDLPEQKEPPRLKKPTRTLRWVWLVVGLMALVMVIVVALQMASGPRRADGTKVDPPKIIPDDGKDKKEDQPPVSGADATGIVLPNLDGAPPWAFVGACWSKRRETVDVVGFLADGTIVSGRSIREGNADYPYWEAWPKTGGGKPDRASRPKNAKEWENAVCVSPAGLVTSAFRRYDPVTFKPLPDLASDLNNLGANKPADELDAMTATANGQFFVGGASTDGKTKRFLVQWETETGNVRGGGTAKTDHNVLAVAANRTGTVMVAGTKEGRVFTHLVAGGGSEWAAPKNKGNDDPCRGVAVSADGKTVYSGHDSDAVYFWKPGQTQPAQTLNAGWPVLALALSSDGRWLAACGNGVTVWDVTANPPKPHELTEDWPGTMKAVAFSADGRRLVVGGLGHGGKPEQGVGVLWLWEQK